MLLKEVAQHREELGSMLRATPFDGRTNIFDDHFVNDFRERQDTIAILRGSIACPVATLQAWHVAAGITTGALFRSIRKGGKVEDVDVTPPLG
jgi:hypothetical protein